MCPRENELKGMQHWSDKMAGALCKTKGGLEDLMYTTYLKVFGLTLAITGESLEKIRH